MNCRCIYCGTGIPSDIGLRCFKCAKGATTGHAGFDKEFEYADELQPRLEDIMGEMERGDRVTSNSNEAKEELQRLQEENAMFRSKHKWENQDELKDSPARVGRILHMNKFLSMLKEAVPEKTTIW